MNYYEVMCFQEELHKDTLSQRINTFVFIENVAKWANSGGHNTAYIRPLYNIRPDILWLYF